MEETGLIAVPNKGPIALKMDVKALLESFYSGKSQRTIEAYKKDWQDFQRFLGVDSEGEAVDLFLSRSPGEANSIALQYRKSLLERGLQATSVNRRLAALRSLTQMARTTGIITWKLEIKNQKAEPYRDTKGPGLDNFKRILSLTEDRGDIKGIRDKAILRLLFDMGLRRGEVVSLDVEDVDLEGKTIDVLGKGRTQKILLSLPGPTIAALDEWLKVRGDFPGPLFLRLDRAKKEDTRITGKAVYLLVRRLGEKIGIKTRPHAIRHSAVTEAVKKAQKNGMDLEEVLDFSRHKDVRTLMMYRDRERNVQGKLSELVAESI